MSHKFQSDYDLHCHSHFSDGILSPAELAALAIEKGVKHLALTDHDSVAGITLLQQAAQGSDLNIIPGVEISVTWNKKVLHIVGLNVNPQSVPLNDLLNRLQGTRIERAERMGAKLDKLGCSGVYELAKQYTGIGMITRSHFARALIDLGFVSDAEAAFTKYLKQGKPAYVSVEWASLEEAVGVIRASGGVAVLAHPQRYNLSATWMRRLITCFKEVGGEGIEVVYGAYNRNLITAARDYAVRFDLLGSVGSDMHYPTQAWNKLGELAPLPSNVTPVWSRF